MGAPLDPRHGLSLLDPARVYHVACAAATRGAVIMKRGHGKECVRRRWRWVEGVFVYVCE